MNLYLIRQNMNRDYDTYDSAVVIANSEEEAKTIHPEGYRWKDNKWRGGMFYSQRTWCHPEHVTVELIGTPTSGDVGDVLIASFNAG